MKKLSPKQLFELQQAGRKVSVVGEVKKEDVVKAPSVAQSLVNLTGYAKQIITKNDKTTVMILQSTESIAKTLTQVADKLSEIATESTPKTWNISVQRGSDKLIHSMKLKST